MIPQSFVVLDGMPSLLVVLVMKTLVTPQGVSSHFVWPFEVWLIFYLLQDLMHWFSEHSVNHLRSHGSRLSSKIPSRSIIIVYVQPKIPHLRKDNLTLPFALLLVFLDPFVLINTIHKPTNTPHQLLGQGFSQIVHDKQADLEGPYSHVIKIPINLIKYLLVPVRVCFKVSPSHMDMDNKESKGRKTQLHVMKQDPNARVSSLKESIEPAPRPSNHLIATGPKLD